MDAERIPRYSINALPSATSSFVVDRVFHGYRLGAPCPFRVTNLAAFRTISGANMFTVNKVLIIEGGRHGF